MSDHVHIDFYINSKPIFQFIDPDLDEFEDLFYRLLNSEIFDFEVKVSFWKGLK